MRSGSKAAFKKLYTAYAPALLGYISKTVPHSRHAEQILQNVFITLWSDAGALSSGPFFTSLLRIARHAISSFLKENGHAENQNIISFVNMHNIDPAPQNGGMAMAVLQEVYFCGSNMQHLAEKLNVKHGELHLLLRDAVMDIKSVQK